jgi:predicted Ser/Thr protein kinase
MSDGSPRFERLDLLGRGSLGSVYRARDRETGDHVALKTLEALGPDQVYHLKREFRTLSALHHPSLVKLHDLVVDGGECFFTMELVDGTDFVTWVRSGGDWLARLLDAGAALADALGAVHRAGRLHRDVKPANVRVRPDGHVVLLDFDLALDLDTARPRDEQAECAGTFAYMAPEQAFGGPIGPPADWYAFGGLLYEAATGRVPFTGALGDVLVQKARTGPPAPRLANAAIPERLDAFLSRLLDPLPDRRPTGDDVRRELAALRGRAAPSAAGPASAPFVGRVRETAQLEAVLTRRRSDLDVVHVHGPSGIGKSELVRRVLRRAEAAGDTLVLRGRCHDRESVPYKAFDTIVDALSTVVRALPADQRRPLVPADGGALVRLFPVLARIPELAVTSTPDLEPQELRQRAFDGLRELFVRLARLRPVVVWIDDLQWADLDSSALLERLARPPEPPALALLLSYRSEDRERVPLLEMLHATPDVAASIHETVVALDALSRDETLELARAMSPPGLETNRHFARIAEEAAGSPFFVGELTRYLSALGAGPDVVAPTLAEVVRARLGRLGDTERTLLELVAVAGGPIDGAVVLDAAGGARLRPVLLDLEEQSLVRSTATAGRVVLEMYHDRLRETVTALAPMPAIAARHGQLAAALERTIAPDPRQLLAHYEGAGDHDGARRFALAAADAANEALAFRRAAELYRRALELGVEDEDGVRARLASVLVDAGIGFDAGRAYEDLARRRAAAHAAPEEIAGLRRSAAELFLQYGHLTEGMAIVRELFADIGMRLPRTNLGNLVWFVRERQRLLRRGFDFTVRDPASIPAPLLARFETAYKAASPLAMSDPIVAGAILNRITYEVLDAGHGHLALRLLGTMANREAVIGTAASRRRAAELIERAERLGVEIADPESRGGIDLWAGVNAFIEGRWREARVRCRRAIDFWTGMRGGVAFQIAIARAYELTAIANLGDLRTLATELPVALSDADARGALGLGIALRMGQPALAWLVEDRPEVGRRLADDWMRRWPSDRVLIPHYNHTIAVVQTHLYEGDGWAAWARTEARWTALRRAGFLMQVSSRVDLLFLRARAAVALATREDGRRARSLLRLATRDRKTIDRLTGLLHAAPHAATIEAAVARAQSRTEDAAAALARAVEGYERAEMALHRAAAARTLGVIRGDATAVAAADDWMRAQGVRRPEAMAAMIVPGG